MSQLAAKMSHFSFQNWQQKFLIPQFKDKSLSFHKSQQKLVISQFEANSFHSRIWSKAFSLDNTRQKLFIRQLTDKFLVPKFASETSQFTICCCKNLSFHNLQQKLLIPQFKAESFL